MSREKNKISSLQNLRGISFLFIFFSHVGIGYFFPSLANWALIIFFMLSGFLCYKNYEDNNENCIIFAIKRIKKIYLLDFVLEIFYFFFWGPSKQTLVYLICHLLLIQSWIPIGDYYNSLSTVSWFLSALYFCYLLFPITIIIVNKIDESKKAIITIISIFIIMILIDWVPYELAGGDFYYRRWFTYYSPFFRCGYFLLGVLLGYVCKKYDRTINGLYIDLHILICVLCIAIRYILTIVYQIIYIPDLIVYIPLTMVLIYYISKPFQGGFVSRCIFLKSRVLLLFGNISGEIFLIHWFVLIVFPKQKISSLINSEYLKNGVIITFELLFSFILALLYKKIYSKLKICFGDKYKFLKQILHK